MESSSWPESLPSNRMKAIEELTQGQPLIEKLRQMLRWPEEIKSSDLDPVDDVVGQILGVFDNTLSILNTSSFNQISAIRTGEIKSSRSWDDQKSEDSGGSVKTLPPLKTKRGSYKRRKNSWTSTKITSNLIDDGYAWRKYGQKGILNATHQRNYYRCTHKVDQGCQATKQVQKTEDKPPKYKITYHGHHTCKNLLRAPQIIYDSPNHSDSSIILNFETKGFTESKQADPCLPSMKNKPKEGFPSLGLRHNQADHYESWNLTAQVPSEPMSMMSSGLDHEDIISSDVYSSTCSTHDYALDTMLGSNDFGDFSFELCS
nr:WRKY1162 [Atractylodes chinensis]